MTPHRSGARTPGASTRRTVLLAGAGALLGACTGPGPTAAPSTAVPSTAVPSTPAGLPAVTPWQPGPGEVQPEVKLRAARLVEALGTRPDGGQDIAAARARVAALGLDPALAGQATALLGPGGPAVLQVVYAQYGGLLADAASVLVVCRQWTAGPSGTTAGGTTVDVRLARAAPQWAVTALHPGEPGPPVTELSAAARRVLAEPRIGLPPAAAADVRAGKVHDSVLEAMLTLAAAYTYEVTVLRSGHPLDVFGTSRPSDHPPGRAVDVRLIDGRAVVDPATPHDLVDGFMRAAAAAGSSDVGGPRPLSGGRTPGLFFSDLTHHDHVHAGFRT